MTTYLFIDLSYFIFYSYYARKKYFEIRKIDTTDTKLIENEEFMKPFMCFDKKINEIKKLAKRKKLDILTTEKDFYRLDNDQKKNIKFLKISLKIKNMNKLKKIIFKNL